MSTPCQKPTKRVSFNDKVTFNSYQASYAVPLKNEPHITLTAQIGMPAKDISKLVPYKRPARLRWLKSLFSKRHSAPCPPHQSIILY
ncbi:hypothetical protein DSO57_1003279 [Entomophthora muscae]|uniref:Uncharacterized protein n=2 Tax=Entomophthora muscae TaxID=34485 RepID=A0ACC2SL55_9FUNG|nr:hypothetical protein DSO57_1003261 [Entomophthora muscae]KAJ9063147.1 hypothetical protein DSO57_1003279 [Entomophthora muscae]